MYGIGLAWKFISSPLGRFLGVLVLLAATYLAGYIKGRVGASNAQEIASLKSELKATQQRLEDNQAIADAARQRAEQQESENEQLEQKLQDYKDHLEKLPADNRCTISDDDVEWLSGLAQGRTPRPGNPSRSPKLR